MRLLVSGSTGLIGSALTGRLLETGHHVTRLVRPATRLHAADAREWDPASGALDPRVFAGVDGVIHVGGASIGSLWTGGRKALLRRSRIGTTRLLAERMAESNPRPAVFVHASAVGIYGDRGDEVLTESSAPGTGFLADLCRDWEAASAAAENAGVRVVRIRTALAMSGRGGVFPLMRRVFRLGLGARVGSGRQWMPWIALDDLVSIYVRAVENASVRGALNAAAPEAVTNAAFTRVLARAVRRPAPFVVPAFAFRALPGGMGEDTVLVSERVVPEALLRAGFRFRFPALAPALEAIASERP